MHTDALIPLALPRGDPSSQTAPAVTTPPGLHFLPSLHPPFGTSATSTLHLSFFPVMVLLSCLGNTCYFIALLMSSMGRNDRPEERVLQAKCDLPVPLLW